MPSIIRTILTLVVSLLLLAPTATAGSPWTATISATAPAWAVDAATELEAELVSTHGEDQRQRARSGLLQVTGFWRAEDGDRETFSEFVRSHFAGDQNTLDTLFTRFDTLLEQIDGHMNEITLRLKRQTDLDVGKILPFDRLFSAYDPAAHVNADFFTNKLAFAVLLNFPVATLDERLRDGEGWSNRKWAEVRLADRFAKRIPAEVQLELARVGAAAAQYIAGYNIWMHHLVNGEGERLFPAGLRLLSHWNLRDEIKANYSEGDAGIAKQRTIQKVMERIATQTIPDVVVDNPHVDWNPFSNEVTAAAVHDSDEAPPADLQISNAPEPDTRYQRWLDNFHAEQLVDPYSPTAPTHVERSFNEQREIPKERVKAMFEAMLASPLLGRVAELIEHRLGRPLEAFDIWYVGFRPRGTATEAELDAVTRQRYPTAAAFEADIPRMLQGLGFSEERSVRLAADIVVEAARGSGHAWGAMMKEAKAHLRTRVGSDGMDYKGYNIAVHEMGHNVEQTVSLDEVDHYLINGVPNTAFTEALAFVFQNRDLELLGLATPSDESRAFQVLDDYWSGSEIAAVALIDMGVWDWLYENPKATPAELKVAVLGIAKDIWNKYYASILGHDDVPMLAVYSHMISRRLYLPAYPIGSLIQAQIENQVAEAGAIGPEFDRMCRTGRVTPDLWMKKAAGAPVGPEALLEATERALQLVGGQSAK